MIDIPKKLSFMKTAEIDKVFTELVKKYGKERVYQELLSIKNYGEREKYIYARVLWMFYDLAYKEDIIQELFRLAKDSSWQVRETVTFSLCKILEKDFGRIYNIFKEKIKSGDIFEKRAIAIAVMRYARNRKNIDELLSLLEPLMYEESIIIRKILGPFVIGDGFIRYSPEKTFNWLYNLLNEDNVWVRWNIAMVFTTKESRKYKNFGMKILEVLKKDYRKEVQKAVAKALKNLQM